MKQRNVQFALEAIEDLNSMFDWISENANADVALGYIERIEDYCSRLDLASERGQLRNDIRPGLRIVGFEHRLVIAFVVDDETVTIRRVMSGRQDWQTLLT